MYTSVLLLALYGSGFVAETKTAPSWMTDYSAARKAATTAKKPLAIFLGSGREGWRELDRDGSLSQEAEELLADKYVRVHINTATAEGMALARAFEIVEGPGLVISDRTGDLQAFRHEGSLDGGQLVQTLQRFADRTGGARATETITPPRVSYYAPPAIYAAPPMSYSRGGCST